MSVEYLGLFVLAFFFSAVLVWPVRFFSWKKKIIDRPDQKRKMQKKPVSLLGGLAVYTSFLLVFLFAWNRGILTDGIITQKQLLAIIIGGFIISVVGFFDDKLNLGPKSFLGPFFAAILAVSFGIMVKYVTNPFQSGIGPYGRSLFYFSGTAAPIFSFFWLIGMMYTTKFLDGLDGLAAGVGLIGSLILFMVSLFWDVPQSGTSAIALIFAGSLCGFLLHNWYPAKIYLGESGSVFIGFMLGILSIISGAKIATALLIMGIPILDVAWVIFRRIFKEKKSPFAGDRKHLHYRLIEAGFSHRGAVLFLCLLSLFFGSTSLFLQSSSKMTALIFLFILMIFIAFFLTISKNKKTPW